jgi:NitT/TauT family transport system ATP-binding protein
VLLIELRSLSFGYPGQSVPVFEGFSWVVEPGECWAVLGPSGSGKTTLLYLVAGLRRPSSGKVLVCGEEAGSSALRGKVGLVLQDCGLLPWATVRDNARLGLRLRRLPSVQREAGYARLDAWLRRLGLEGLQGKYPAQLSGGEKQRVALARALVLEPQVLLLDEPFSALDVPMREELQRLVRGLWQEMGNTLVFVTHNIEEALFIGQKVLLLRRPPNRSAHVIENPLAGASSQQWGMREPGLMQELRSFLAEGRGL